MSFAPIAVPLGNTVMGASEGPLDLGSELGALVMDIGEELLKRRKFLQMGLTATTVGAIISCGRFGNSSSWRFFTEEEARTVIAVCEQIIPEDDHPGASQARVVNYIDIQLTGHLKKYQDSYRKGIAGIDAASRKLSGKGFAKSTAAQQAEVLTEMEQNAEPFFDLILSHTFQGFYGDPRHGGNRHMVSWRMVGLPFPPLRGRQHYEEPKEV